MNYMAEDFKDARFAEHDNGRTAMRPQAGRMWDLGSVRMDDYDMAHDGWRPVREAPITLDTLREAWENAEVPTADRPIRVGDECIMPLDDLWMVGLEGDDWMPSNDGDTRVLRRAPQPQPWEELMEVLSEVVGAPVEPWQAQWAYESGVRVTGGDDDE